MKLHFTLLFCLLSAIACTQDCGDLRIDIPAEIVLCQAGSTTLTADITGPVDAIQWSPLTGLLSPDAATTTAEVTANITYTVTARRVADTELINNGDFTQGDTGFTSDYIYGTGGGVGLLSNEGQYAIADNARDTHNQFARCRDRSGNGNMMVVNASGDPSNVWCQTVTIQANTDYQFSAWVTSVVSENPAQLQFAVNGNLLGTPYNASPNTCSWQNFNAEWQSDNATTAEICISNTNFTPAGNDFALDDISLREICVAAASVSVRIPELDAEFDLATELCSTSPTIDPNTLLLPTSTPGGSWVLDDVNVNVLVPSTLTVGPHRLEYRLTDGDCTAQETRDFNIVAAPNAGAAITADEACFTANEAVNLPSLLNGADTGGDWALDSGPIPASLDVNAGVATLNQAGTYTFVYRVAGNAVCGEDTETVTVIRTPPPVADLPPSLILDCDMPTTELGGPNTSMGLGINYRWLRNGEGYPGTTPTLLVDTDGTYTLEVRDAAGCETTASVAVVDQVVELTVTAEALQAPCADPKGGGIQIVSITGGTEPYLSSLDDSPFSMVAAYSNLAAGNYEVRVQDAGGCEGSVNLQLQEPVQPTLMISADLEQPVVLGESITLRALTSIMPNNLDTLIWSPAIPDSLQMGLFQWRITPLATTNYVLTAIDMNGCSVQANLLVPVALDGRIFVPNAISPNEDGSNDRFVIHDGGAVARILNLQVFNRWGSQVYQSNGLTTNSEAGTWDGTHAGQRLPADVYVYSLVVEWISGEVTQLSGEIHLVY